MNSNEDMLQARKDAGARAEELRKKRLEEAAIISDLLESEGGEFLMKKIDKMLESLIQPPEVYLDDNRVNENQVAADIGGRNALMTLKVYLLDEKEYLDSEVEKQSKEERKQ